MMTAAHHREGRHNPKQHRAAYGNVAIIFVLTVALGLVLVGVAVRGTSPLALVLPLVIAYFTITSMRH